MEEACSVLLRHALLTCAHLAISDDRMDARSKHVSLTTLTEFHSISYLFTLISLLFRPFNSDWTVQRLLIGTHTSNDEQNYVQIIKVKVPQESSKDTREYREGLDEAEKQNTTGQEGKTGQGTSAQGSVGVPKNERIQVELQINHQGEVNKARYMP